MRRDDPTTRLEVQLTVQGDSQLVIKQLTREYRCKHPKLQVYLNQARRLVEDLSQLCLLRIEFQHVLREYNSVADGKVVKCLSLLAHTKENVLIVLFYHCRSR